MLSFRVPLFQDFVPFIRIILFILYDILYLNIRYTNFKYLHMPTYMLLYLI